MDGAAHYKKAEELLDASETTTLKDVDMRMLRATQGVGHALLALTAANAQAPDVQAASRQASAWSKVIR